MTFTDRLLQLLNSSSSLLVLLALVVTGTAMMLGIGFGSADRFLDAREWMRAVGECLRSL